ncbi:hypothetical protein BCR37DRAFT_392197 [Protomyces lactucae-debilis]|uniref:Uncharacterized protein n=1 Tax=Protomyces lactucae-debilis TaxID=2754530 RepID=A0A1Y2FJG6_PROLT|nr:uncharacterized protein BCR37DRAFT_392197 [Protomyces lactucae-debilis]ORY83737.1 hypothetical protein BCR37DRAFT_392197 [Protomyces lactucae-debilis]
MRSATLSLLSLLAGGALSCDNCAGPTTSVQSQTQIQFSLSVTINNIVQVIATDGSSGKCVAPTKGKPDVHGVYVKPVTDRSKNQICRHQLPTDKPGQKTGICKVPYVKSKTEETKGKGDGNKDGEEDGSKDDGNTEENDDNDDGTKKEGHGTSGGINGDDGDKTDTPASTGTVGTSTEGSPAESTSSAVPTGSVLTPTKTPPASNPEVSNTPGVTGGSVTGKTCVVVSQGSGAIWSTGSTVVVVVKGGGALIIIESSQVDLNIHIVVGFSIQTNVVTLSGYKFYYCSTETDDMEIHAYPGQAPTNCQATTITTVTQPPKLSAAVPALAPPAVVAAITGNSSTTTTITAESHQTTTFSYSSTTTTTTTTSTSWSSAGGVTLANGDGSVATGPDDVENPGETGLPSVDPTISGLAPPQPSGHARLPGSSSASTITPLAWTLLLLPMAILATF